jgi:hypothetical protein
MLNVYIVGRVEYESIATVLSFVYLEENAGVGGRKDTEQQSDGVQAGLEWDSSYYHKFKVYSKLCWGHECTH